MVVEGDGGPLVERGGVRLDNSGDVWAGLADGRLLRVEPGDIHHEEAGYLFPAGIGLEDGRGVVGVVANVRLAKAWFHKGGSAGSHG